MTITGVVALVCSAAFIFVLWTVIMPGNNPLRKLVAKTKALFKKK